MQGCQKNIFNLDQISFFSLRITKCGWFTYIYTGNICILQLKNCKLMFWNKALNCALFAVSQELYTLLDRTKQIFFGSSKDFTTFMFFAFLLCWCIKVKFMNNQLHICIRKRALHNMPMVAHRRSTGNAILILNISTTLGWVNSSMPHMLCSQ